MKKKLLSIMISSILALGGLGTTLFYNPKNSSPVANESSIQEESSKSTEFPSSNATNDEESNSNADTSEVAENSKDSAENISQVLPSVEESSKNTDTEKEVAAKPESSNKGQGSASSSNIEKPNTDSSSKPANGLPSISKNYDVEFLSKVEDEVLRLSNEERAKAGLKPMSMDSSMRNAARYKAEEMLQYRYFDHNSPYTGSPFELLKKFNVSYNAAGENIQSSTGRSKASVTAEYIVTNWMNSPGHRANILNGNFTRMGVGVAFSSNGNLAYESQLFAN